MKEIFVSTQAELDALPARFEEYTRIIIKNTATRLSVVARGNSSVEARENSSVEARENSSVEAWGNSSVVAWGNSSVVAWGNSSVVARGNSSVEARGNSSVEAWGNSVIRIFSSSLQKIILYGFAVAFVPVSITIKIEKKSDYCHIQKIKDLGWFERNGVEKTETMILYKRVSSDYKTQENTKNETLWAVGTTVDHPAWQPASQECGEGKFHACSKTYFCDEFREAKGDRYIAISVNLDDIYEWTDKPLYLYKIAFRKGTVLYECDRLGKQIEVKA